MMPLALALDGTGPITASDAGIAVAVCVWVITKLFGLVQKRNAGSGIGRALGSLEASINALTAQVSDLRGDLKEVRSELSTLASKHHDSVAEIAGIVAEIRSLDGRVRNIERKQTNDPHGYA